MPNRILKDSVCTSDNLDRLTAEQEVFWYRLLVQCDDYGRMDARPAILRARCYPLRLDSVSEQDVTDWLAALVASDLIRIYEVAGKPYLQVVTWDRHQQVRAKRSKYPTLISDDSNGYQMIADAPVIQSNPNPIRESNAILSPLQAVSGNGSGRTYSDKLKALNDKLGPELRRTLADELLKITGQLDLAHTETDAGTAALYAAHEAAVTVYQMGYKTAEDLMTAEDDWYANDFRGKQQTRPTIKWFLEQCAQTKAGRRDTSPKPVEEWR